MSRDISAFLNSITDYNLKSSPSPRQMLHQTVSIDELVRIQEQNATPARLANPNLTCKASSESKSSSPISIFSLRLQEKNVDIAPGSPKGIEGYANRAVATSVVD